MIVRLAVGNYWPPKVYFLPHMFGKNDRRQLKRRCIVHGIFLSTHLNVNGEDVSSRSQDLFGGQLAVRVTSKNK